MALGAILPALGAIGGIMGALGAGKTKPAISERNIYNPEQLQMLSRLLQGGSGGIDFLQGLYSPNSETIQSMQQPYINQFNQQTIPQIAERFSSLGAQGSSAFGHSLSSAAGDLNANLASLSANTQLQGLGPIMQMLQMSLSPQTQPVVNQNSNSGGFFGNFLGGLGSQLSGPLSGKILDMIGVKNKYQGQA